jgi:hypothetical protein
MRDGLLHTCSLINWLTSYEHVHWTETAMVVFDAVMWSWVKLGTMGGALLPSLVRGGAGQR